MQYIPIDEHTLSAMNILCIASLLALIAAVAIFAHLSTTRAQKAQIISGVIAAMLIVCSVATGAVSIAEYKERQLENVHTIQAAFLEKGYDVPKSAIRWFSPDGSTHIIQTDATKDGEPIGANTIGYTIARDGRITVVRVISSE